MLCLIGNKIDSLDRKIVREEVLQFVKELNIPIYEEVSAQNGNNVVPAINSLMEGNNRA